MNKPSISTFSHEDFLKYALSIMQRPENKATARVIKASIYGKTAPYKASVWSIKVVTLGFGQLKLCWNCYRKEEPNHVDSVFEMPWDTDYRKTPMTSWVNHSELFIEFCEYEEDPDVLNARVHRAYFDQQNPYISAHFKHPVVSYCVDV